jgi:hypothetical protein
VNVRRFLTVLISCSMFLCSMFPFVKSAEAKRTDVSSVKSTTSVVLNHATQLYTPGSTANVAQHESHSSHYSHGSHTSHYSSSY